MEALKKIESLKSELQLYVNEHALPVVNLTFMQYVLVFGLKFLAFGGECKVFTDKHSKNCYKFYNLDEYAICNDVAFGYVTLFQTMHRRNSIMQDFNKHQLVGITKDYKYAIYKQLYAKPCNDLNSLANLANVCNDFFNTNKFTEHNICNDSWKFEFKRNGFYISDITNENVTLYNSKLFFYDMDIYENSINNTY